MEPVERLDKTVYANECYLTSENQLVHVQYDQYSESPRTFTDGNIGKFFLLDRGNKLNETEFEDWNAILKHFGVESTRNLEKDIALLEKAAVKKDEMILPVTKYDHSGVNIFVGLPGEWDYTFLGVIMLDKKALKDLGCEHFTREEIEKELKQEVNTYSEWYDGNVYEVVLYDIVKDEDGDLSLDEVERTGNLYGYQNLKELKADFISGNITDYLGDYEDADNALYNNLKEIRAKLNAGNEPQIS